jgi:hypothetical protein
MPRPRIRLAGIVLVALLGAGCQGVQAPKVDAPPPPPSAAPLPSPTAAGNWTQALDFSGDVTGTMSAVVPATPQVRSECTGRNSRPAGVWASTIFGFVGSDVYGVLFAVGQYRGPGSYSSPDVTVQVHSSDNSAVWQSAGANSATFTVAPDEQSGTVEAKLTNLGSNQTTLQVNGSWSCRT